MEYSQLSKDDQKAMLEGRLRQYEQEHYNHELNVKALESQTEDETTKRAITEARKAQEIIDTAYDATKSELDSLG